jgi:hypothetical protein
MIAVPDESNKRSIARIDASLVTHATLDRRDRRQGDGS